MAIPPGELGASEAPPTSGTVFLSTHDRDKSALLPVAQRLDQMGFRLVAEGTARALEAAGLKVEIVLKVHEGRPNIEDAIRSGAIQLVINTPLAVEAAHDDKYLRPRHRLRRDDRHDPGRCPRCGGRDRCTPGPGDAGSRLQDIHG